MELFLYGLIASLISLTGGFLVLWRSKEFTKITTLLMAFAAGAFLGISFLDLLPEAVEMVDEAHSVFIAFLFGVAAFFALERFLMKHVHRHETTTTHADHTESLPVLIVLGDSLHNFLDGIVIALAYIANPALGLTTALAVAAHEVPQEIGEFSILLDQGWSKMKILMVNIASSLMTLVGIFVGYMATTFFEGWLAYLLAGAAGVFTYIALSDLVPELHHRAGHKHFYRIVLVFLAGLFLVGYLVSIAHGHE